METREQYNARMRIYMIDRYHQLATEARSYLGNRCVDCGTKERLEFDHVDPKDKSFNISKAWSYSRDKFWDEINKCVLRCKTCHQKRTSLQKSVPHGGGVTGKRNCYCELCGPLKREYMRKRRRSKGRYPRGQGN